MSENRLNGKKVKVDWLVGSLDHLVVIKLPGMLDVTQSISAPSVVFPSKWGGRATQEVLEPIRQRALNSEPERLKHAIEVSEHLIQAAVSVDSRLANRSRWMWSDEGETGCPAAIACNEDRPFLRRQKARVSHHHAAGRPLRVVISTDSKQIGQDAAAAFIATARLVQQFRPLEIWWQGAWLKHANEYESQAYEGFVFHVPLTHLDMDWARLDFVIQDPSRDKLSWCQFIKSICLDRKLATNQCGEQGRVSYLENTDVFVKHTGIEANAVSVAEAACKWLGWRPHFCLRYDAERAGSAALQSWTPPDTGTGTAAPVLLTPEQAKKQEKERERIRKRWDADDKRREREREKAAKERLKNAAGQ